MSEAESLVEAVAARTSPAGCSALQHDMEVLRAELKALLSSHTETTELLQSCLFGLDEFETEHEQFAAWLVDSEEKVKVNTVQTLSQEPQVHLEQIEVRIIYCHKTMFFEQNTVLLPQ